MSEEAEAAEVSEPSFDMDGAVEGIAGDLFDTTEEVEIEEDGVEKEIGVELKKAEEKEEKTQEEKQAREAPKSWRKEMREFYGTADPVLQDYIDQREKQMHEGIEKDRGDANLGRSMRDVISPFAELLGEKDPAFVVKSLLQAHNSLTRGSPEQKMALMQQLAQSYGVEQRGGEGAEAKALMQRMQNIEQNIDASQKRSQQESRVRIESEVSTFAEDHPYFDDLSEDMTKLIQVGYGLEEAYEKAMWSNPVTRQKELDRQTKESANELEKKGKQEAEAALKAKSVNVKGINTKKSPTAPKGKFLDDSDMHETLREIKSRN